MPKKKYKKPKKEWGIITRRLETQGLVRMRANHIDTRIATLTTFLPFEVEWGDDHVTHSTYSDLPIIIFTDGKAIWFEFVEKDDQVFKLAGKKYRLEGKPQSTATMFSLEGFMQLFGTNPEPNVRKSCRKLPKIIPEEILLDIEEILRTFTGFFDAQGKMKENLYRLVTYWVFQTYIYDVWSKASYLKVMGIHDTGKSTLSRVIELLSFCSERSTAKVTDSWFYRNLHATGGVQCLDEMDLNPKDNAVFLNLLKAGWMKGAYVHLTNTDDNNLSDAFNTYSPKLLSGTSVQNIDPVLSSRMIEITMRSAPKGHNYSLEDLFEDEILERTRKIRDKLYLFRLIYAHEYLRQKKVRGNIKVLGKKGKEILSNRQWDIYNPILTMANLHGGQIYIKDLVVGIEEQIEIKRLEFFETFDLPIIRVLYDATRIVKKVWLSSRAISDTIIQIYAGNDSTRRKYMIARYDWTIIEKHLKGLGVSRKMQYSMNGIDHLFVREDIDSHIKKRGIQETVATRSQQKEIRDLINLMARIQEEEDYPETGIPLEAIQDQLNYNPLVHLYHLSQTANPPIMQMKKNRWLVLIKGGIE